MNFFALPFYTSSSHLHPRWISLPRLHPFLHFIFIPSVPRHSSIFFPDEFHFFISSHLFPSSFFSSSSLDESQFPIPFSPPIHLPHPFLFILSSTSSSILISSSSLFLFPLPLPHHHPLHPRIPLHHPSFFPITSSSSSSFQFFFSSSSFLFLLLPLSHHSSFWMNFTSSSSSPFPLPSSSLFFLFLIPFSLPLPHHHPLPILQKCPLNRRRWGKWRGTLRNCVGNEKIGGEDELVWMGRSGKKCRPFFCHPSTLNFLGNFLLG